MSADVGPEIDVGAAPEVMIFQEKKQKKKARKPFPAEHIPCRNGTIV